MRANRAPDFVGVSPHADLVRTEIARLGPWPCTVLIEGETGTGKDVVARLLHAASGRRDAPFVITPGIEFSIGIL